MQKLRYWPSPSLRLSAPACRSTTLLALTVPNVLTGSRILLAIAGGVFFAAGVMEIPAVVLCVAAVMLDGVDGWYARRFSQCTKMGMYLDPLADKIAVAVIFAIIAAKMDSPLVWTLYALIVIREVGITVTRSYRYWKSGDPMPSGTIGKIKMVVQSTTGSGILIYAYCIRGDFAFSHYPVAMAFFIVAVLSYLSGYRYLFQRL